MLLAIAETIRKIQSGIKHKNNVSFQINGEGLSISSMTTTSTTRITHLYERVFSWGEMEMIKFPEHLISDYVDSANEAFRKAYHD